ncbi:unnamed protein product [Protopolystoma xenopodis]|uniref:Uncharacterized protein n=1 Tax=Protopolystoma xenopodis TaxID=117903 RepID=A0A3S5FFR6_9PLAT|nr:unnamed protein product [Protopolystoma xenopodis]
MTDKLEEPHFVDKCLPPSGSYSESTCLASADFEASSEYAKTGDSLLPGNRSSKPIAYFWERKQSYVTTDNNQMATKLTDMATRPLEDMNHSPHSQRLSEGLVESDMPQKKRAKHMSTVKQKSLDKSVPVTMTKLSSLPSTTTTQSDSHLLPHSHFTKITYPSVLPAALTPPASSSSDFVHNQHNRLLNLTYSGSDNSPLCEPISNVHSSSSIGGDGVTSCLDTRETAGLVVAVLSRHFARGSFLNKVDIFLTICGTMDLIFFSL